MKQTLPAVFALALVLAGGGVAQATEAAAEKGETGQFWVNPGMYSVHFQNKDLNSENWGLGVEYRCADTQSLTAGFFRNSNSKTSHYLGMYWMPLQLGPLKLGVTAGAIDGYPNYRDGGWFPAVIPAASYERGRFGLNVLLLPTYKDRINGALSFQFKMRVP